ncbi:MAG: hypothetical protein J7K90_02920 [Desulfuromusa sp.]|nr:hypothetical protein [Desulfuromusa sp.]
MIWLSPTNGTNDCSIYFEIRDIDLQCHGNVTSGVVRGLLGDGYCELWGEVFLGSVEYAQILPVWTDSGEIESFSAAVDESLLQQQMLSEVKTFLQKMDNMGDHSPTDDRLSSDFSEPDPACHLAA